FFVGAARQQDIDERRAPAPLCFDQRVTHFTRLCQGDLQLLYARVQQITAVCHRFECQTSAVDEQPPRLRGVDQGCRRRFEVGLAAFQDRQRQLDAKRQALFLIPGSEERIISIADADGDIRNDLALGERGTLVCGAQRRVEGGDVWPPLLGVGGPRRRQR